MLVRTFNFSRFITYDNPNTQTKLTLLITEARAIEPTFNTTNTRFDGTQNEDSQKRLCIKIPLYPFSLNFVTFENIIRHNHNKP